MMVSLLVFIRVTSLCVSILLSAIDMLFPLKEKAWLPHKNAERATKILRNLIILLVVLTDNVTTVLTIFSRFVTNVELLASCCSVRTDGTAARLKNWIPWTSRCATHDEHWIQLVLVQVRRKLQLRTTSGTSSPHSFLRRELENQLLLERRSFALFICVLN